MTARRDFDPIGNYNFGVEMDGLTVARFAGVDGLAYESELIEYRVSDQPMLPRFRPGTAKFGSITLKRGFTETPDLQDWMAAVQGGVYKRRDLTITLYDNHGDTVASWNLFRCLPTKWSLGSLDGKGNEALHETLELKVEEIEMVGQRSRRTVAPPPGERPRAQPFPMIQGPGINQTMIDHGEGLHGTGINQTMIDHGEGLHGEGIVQTVIDHGPGIKNTRKAVWDIESMLASDGAGRTRTDFDGDSSDGNGAPPPPSEGGGDGGGGGGGEGSESESSE